MKCIRMSVLTLAVLFVTAGVVHATSIDVTGSDPKLEITSEGPDGIQFRVEVGQMETFDVSTKGGDFTRILIPGFHTSMIEGAPELPMMNRLVSIPIGAEPQIEVTNVRTTTIRLADFGVTNRIMPAQPSLSKSEDPANVPFIYLTDIYNQTEVRRELVNLVDQGRMRAMDISRLEISPVTYYPSTGELEIVESLDVAITYRGASHAAATDLAARTYSPFFEHLYKDIAGTLGFHDDYPDRVGDVVTMVSPGRPNAVSIPSWP